MSTSWVHATLLRGRECYRCEQCERFSSSARDRRTGQRGKPETTGHPCDRARGRRQRGDVMATPLPAVAPAHGKRALEPTRTCVRRRRPALPVKGRRGELPGRLRGAFRHRGAVERARHAHRERGRSNRGRESTEISPRCRGDRGRHEPATQSGSADRSAALPRCCRPRESLCGRWALRRPPGTRRRRGKQWGRDCARSHRTPCTADLVRPHACERRAARFPRSADTGHQHPPPPGPIVLGDRVGRSFSGWRSAISHAMG